MSDQIKTREGRSTAGLISEAMTYFSGLLRKEVDLVRAELNENVRKAGVAIGLIVGAIVVILVALNVLSAAIVAGLTELGIEAGWASLIVGVVYFVIALVMIKKGTGDLKATSLAPTRAARSARKDAHAIKETLNG